MAGQLHLAKHLAVSWADRRKRTAPVPDVKSIGAGIVPHVVGILAEPNALGQVIVVGVHHLDPLALTVRDGDRLAIWNNRDTLRLMKSRQALDVTAILHVDDLHGVVAKRGDEQS